MSDGAERAASRLQAAAATVKVPSAMLASFHEAPPEPTAGQIWRAVWDDVVELVAITNVTGTEMAVVPITFETKYADSQAHVLPAEATSLGMSVAAWTGMEEHLPVRVLHRCLGAVSGEMTPSWPQSVPGAQQGRRIVTPVDPRVQHRAELEDHLDLLREAEWAPAGTGALAQWLQAAGIGVAELGEVMGCTPAQALALRRGQAVVTESEAERLAPVLGRSVDDILGANPPVPKPLRARLDYPAWRAFVQRLAALRDIPERLAWQAAAYGTLRMAGRVTVGDDSAIWDKRLERYFQATLDL